MNIRLRLVACLLVVVLSTSGLSFASDTTGRHGETPHDTTQDFESVAADAIIARPLWLVATVVGGAIFVVALPVAAISKSVDKTAKALVVRPARATFSRPLGDFSSL